MRNTRPSKKCYPFRVFVSYSHEDQDKAEQVVDVLRKLGMVPIWDEHITPGAPFSDAIKGLIAHSHVFLPLITSTSMKKPWVHQETGYAMALDIPVLPVAIAKRPDQMIAQLEAVMVSPDLGDLEDRLSEVNLENVVFPGPSRPKSSMEVADEPEDRAEMLARGANRVLQHGVFAHFRQSGALSSFCISDEDPENPVWDCREDKDRRSKYYRNLQRQERIAFERHARGAGFSLMIDPSIEFSSQGSSARRTRLATLLHFLESAAQDKSLADQPVLVVTTPHAREANLTIVGDWFAAESIVPRPKVGYKQTVFDWHPPTVLQRVRQFDSDLNGCLTQQGLEVEASLSAAIGKLREIIKKLPACRTWRTLPPELRGPCCHIAERMSRERARTRRRAG